MGILTLRNPETEKDVSVQVDGVYFLDSNEWSPWMAIVMAKEDGIDLYDEKEKRDEKQNKDNSDRWKVILHIREHCDRFQFYPHIKILTKDIRNKYGKELGNTRRLYELFPEGPRAQARKYAGVNPCHD